MREALYAKRFFRQEFGKASEDVFLPDSFGFGYALPSVAAHSGLKGFSTQKLTWGSSYGIPFPVGRWKGVDGSEVVAELNPGDYVTKLRSDISVDPSWSKDLISVGNGRRVGFRYFGTGDVGGAPDEQSVEWLEKSIANKSGIIEIHNTSADQLVRDLQPSERASLPVYQGELTMKTHGVGCYTSQAAMKRFNRENELLGDSSERAAVAAQWLAGLPYPGDRLRSAWVRFLWHQFHDDLTGTCIPQAYLFSWNDELVSANQFAGVLTSSVAAVANLLNTAGPAIPVVVYNPLATARKDPVEATIEFPGAAPNYIRVLDETNQLDVPVQILERQGPKVRILFLAEVPSVGFKVFQVRPSPKSAEYETSLNSAQYEATSLIENKRYKVEIDANGDIAHVFDRNAGKELLSAPIRLEMRDDPSPDKPAWRILWDTVNAPVREYPRMPMIRVVENGPVRSAIEITRKAAGSTFVQRVLLTEGGDRVDVENWVDWRSPNTLLKAAFPLAASNPHANYDLGLGAIDRENNTPDHYEVPAQKWADFTDASGAFGAAILNDSKYGWDKPSDQVIRLSLIHTPKPRAYSYQGSNDLGHHHFIYAIVGHRGDWRDGGVPTQAAALNQPLVAFQTLNHNGPLGGSFSMLSLDTSNGQVAVRALKKAEDGDEIVIRLQEQFGRVARVRIKLAAKVTSAYEMNAAEERLGPFEFSAGEIVVDLKPFQPRTLALRMQTSTVSTLPRVSVALNLPYNLDGISADADRYDGDFDGKRQTLAAEQLPREMQIDGITFHLGSSAHGALNLVVPKGQELALPPGSNNRLYILASAVGGDSQTSFTISGPAGTTSESVTVNEWQGPIGQWDSRLRNSNLMRMRYVPQFKGQSWTPEEIQSGMVVETDLETGGVRGIDNIHRGFVKRSEIAWVGTHRHAPDGNQPYIPAYVFMYSIDLPASAREVRLPNDDRIRILAMSVARAPQDLWPAGALFAADLPEPPDSSNRRY